MERGHLGILLYARSFVDIWVYVFTFIIMSCVALRCPFEASSIQTLVLLAAKLIILGDLPSVNIINAAEP